MATSTGRWSEGRIETVRDHIVEFLLERNTWLRHWKPDVLIQFTALEKTQIQYFEAKAYIECVGPMLASDGEEDAETLIWHLQQFEGGLDAGAIRDRLLDLKKPFLQLSTKQVTFFVRKNIPKIVIEEYYNTRYLVEFKVNGYKAPLKEIDRLPVEWRTTTQDVSGLAP